MSKKESKLREALGNLFKARGELIETPSMSQKEFESKSVNRGKLQKELHSNGSLKNADKKHKVSNQTKQKKQEGKVKIKHPKMSEKKEAKKKEKKNDMGAETSKTSNSQMEEKQFKKTSNTQKNVINNKTNKQNSLKPSKEKSMQSKKQSEVKDDTFQHPPGYFVMNHNQSKAKKDLCNPKEKPTKQNLKKNKKVQNQKDKVETLSDKTNIPVHAKKRKANKDLKGPQSKVYKHQNGQFDSESSSENTETSIEQYRELSKFDYLNYDFDEDSYTDLTDETDTTEEYSDGCDDEIFSDEYDDDAYPFDCDDMDDTYSEQSTSEYLLSESDSLNSIHDPDYELPKTVPEDHIIHKGLAVMHDFTADHDIQFDEHNESAQIVELPNVVITVEQHQSLNLEHLRTLELDYVKKSNATAISIRAQEQNKDDGDGECPELVPIEDVDFKLWTSGIEMDDELFSECTDYMDDSDEESITADEGNINNKYMKHDQTSDSDESFDNYGEGEEEEVDESSTERPQKFAALNMKADVIVTEPQSLSPFKLNAPEKALKEPLSLAEIIALTQGQLDSSNVTIKSAVINEAIMTTINKTDENLILEDADTMRACAEVQDSEKVFLQLTENVIQSDDSVVSSIQTSPISDERTERVSTMLFTTEDLEVDKFKTKFFDSIDSHKVLVLLKSAFYIYGTLKATLIAGSAEVFGYKLVKWQTRQLYSPRGVCALQISPLSKSKNASVSTDNTKEEILATISTFSNECEFHPQHLEKLLANFEPSTDAILLLSRNDDADNIKRMLQLHVKENIFPAHIPQSRLFYTSEFLLDCMINAKYTEYPLQIPPQWYNLRLETNSKCLLVGGKSVGKSTLLRFLVNQHLNKFPAVLVIDLDIGQPEIFTSQAVSCALIQQPLLGPGFLYGIKPDKAFCVGHSNVVLCAHRYLPAVLDLLHYCNEEPRYRNIPCIVNTMGYNKGFGSELMAVIIEHLRPTDIVHLQSNLPINNFDFLFEPHIVPTIERNVFNREQYAATNAAVLNHRLHVMPSAILQQGRYQREWQMSAKDMRYIMLLTHLSQILNEYGEVLNNKQTYCVNMDALNITNPLSSRSTPSDIAKSLVSNLVYLGHNNTKNTELKTIECFGIGIVRAIDWPANQLYLLTALPLERLNKVNSLTPGDMPLPASMLTLQNLSSNVDVPFVQNVTDEATSRAIRQFFSRT